MSVTHTYYVAALGPKGRSAVHWSRRALVHAAGHWGRTGSLTSLPVLPLSLVDEEHWRRWWSTGHHRSLMDLGGTVDFRRVVDEFCSPIPFPFACTTDYYILRHPRCLQRLLDFQFRIVIIGIGSRLGHPRGIALGRHSILPSLYHYSYLLHFYPVYPFLFCLLSSVFLFSPPYHSLYLVNLHISPSRSAYHHHIPIHIFLRDFLVFSLRSSRSFRSSLPLFLETYHSLYLANLHISSSRSAYHYDILYTHISS